MHRPFCLQVASHEVDVGHDEMTKGVMLVFVQEGVKFPADLRSARPGQRQMGSEGSLLHRDSQPCQGGLDTALEL